MNNQLFHTVTDGDMRKAIDGQRGKPNAVSQQIRAKLVPDHYVTQELPGGFSFHYGDGNCSANHEFVKACVEFGHRLAMEGKDIVQIATATHFSNERCQREIAVVAKFKYRLKKREGAS
jgi:hypothetical protein